MKETGNMKETACLSTKENSPLFQKELSVMNFVTLSKDSLWDLVVFLHSQCNKVASFYNVLKANII